jgi:hypothetical protein
MSLKTENTSGAGGTYFLRKIHLPGWRLWGKQDWNIAALREDSERNIYALSSYENKWEH